MSILYTTKVGIGEGLTKLARLAAAVIVIAGSFSLPARAEKLAQSLGPVGPLEAILADVGSKRVIAFYTPVDGQCDTSIVVWDPTDDKARSTIRVRMKLYPHQIVSVQTAESLGVRCGDNAGNLTIADSGRQPTQLIR